jgi:hypothetical protein
VSLVHCDAASTAGVGFVGLLTIVDACAGRTDTAPGAPVEDKAVPTADGFVVGSDADDRALLGTTPPLTRVPEGDGDDVGRGPAVGGIADTVIVTTVVRTGAGATVAAVTTGSRRVNASRSVAGRGECVRASTAIGSPAA